MPDDLPRASDISDVGLKFSVPVSDVTLHSYGAPWRDIGLTKPLTLERGRLYWIRREGADLVFLMKQEDGAWLEIHRQPFGEAP